MTNVKDIQEKSIKLKPEEITKHDVLIAWLRFYFANEIPHSFDRYIAPSLLWALIPVLKKLYKDKDELRDAYQRHLLFFNTQISYIKDVLNILSASSWKGKI